MRGNSRTLKVSKGVRSHPPEESNGDYYATPPLVTEAMLKGLKRFNIDLGRRVLEPCCGEGHISEVLKLHGYKVFSYDKVYRGYGRTSDFLLRSKPFNGSIVTNPPYYDDLPVRMIRKGLELIPDGKYLVFLTKLSFLSGKSRSILFEDHNPKLILVHSSRVGCALNGDFSKRIPKGMDYCWVVFKKGYVGPTTLGWIGGTK